MAKITKKPPRNWVEVVLWLISTLGPLAWKAIEGLIRWLTKRDLKKLLDGLDKLKDEGKISEQEYAQMREKIIAEVKAEDL